jgi:hypothetical protein
MSQIINALERRWNEHLEGCTQCTDWYESGGNKGLRCLDGWALSTVFENELEKGMPAEEEAAISGESR